MFVPTGVFVGVHHPPRQQKAALVSLRRESIAGAAAFGEGLVSVGGYGCLDTLQSACLDSR